MKEIFAHAIPGVREFVNGPGIDRVLGTLEVELKFYFIWIFIGRREVLLSTVASIVAVLFFAQVFLIRIHPMTYVTFVASCSIHYLIYFFIGTITFFTIHGESQNTF